KGVPRRLPRRPRRGCRTTLSAPRGRTGRSPAASASRPPRQPYWRPMSRNQRIGLLVAAVVVAAVAIVVAVASGGNDSGDQAAETTQTSGQGQSQTGGGEPTETAPAVPAVHRIQIRDGKVVGGTAAIKVTK